ncbi:MAG: hypothetical protein KAI39_02870 [Desulfobulbaceae bacterium]|nr:hypothetical protein [Desulfobulbaceae bacterium]
MQDIDQMLSIEIKKDIADRYFGFRKLIEENIQDYDDQIVSSFRRMEQKIGYDLIRLYILLKDGQLIHDFFKIAGLETMGLNEQLFYDPYLTESDTIRKRVFAGRSVGGLTRKSRFRNMGLDTYEELERNINEYRETFHQLLDERETIREEIKLFYKKNDLGTIMGFLRGLGGSGAYKTGAMEGGLTPNTGESLNNKMKVKPPPPVEEFLPDIPAINPMQKIKGDLKTILDKAYQRQNEPEMREIAHP